MAICPSNNNAKNSRDCPLISKTLKKNQIPAYDTFGPFPDETILSSIDRVLFFLGVKRVQRFLSLPTPYPDDSSSSEHSEPSHRSQNECYRSCCAMESLGQLENGGITSDIVSTLTSQLQAEEGCQTSKMLKPEDGCQTSKMLKSEEGCQTSKMLQLEPQTGCQTSKMFQQGARSCQTSKMFQQGAHSCQTSKMFQPGAQTGCQTSQMFQQGTHSCQTSKQLRQTAGSSGPTSNILEQLKNSPSFDPAEAIKAFQANPAEALKALHEIQQPLSFSQSGRSSQVFQSGQSLPSGTGARQQCACSQCRASEAQDNNIPRAMSDTGTVRSMYKNSGAQMIDGGCGKKVTLPLKRSFSLCSLACRKMKQTFSNVSAKKDPAKWIWSRLQCFSDGTKIYEVYKNTSLCSNPADAEVEHPTMIFVVLPNNVIVPFESVTCHT